MTAESIQDEVLPRLMRVYSEFSGARRVTAESQMCRFWEDPTVEILVDSDELNALELEFDIEFDDDTAMELYDATLQAAAMLIKKMIQEQSAKSHESELFIDNLAPELAARVLREIWRDSFKARRYIPCAGTNCVFGNADVPAIWTF